jgi:hypothetical protein
MHFFARRSACQELFADMPACNMSRVPRTYVMDIRSEAAVLRRRRLIDATVEVLGEVGARPPHGGGAGRAAEGASASVVSHCCIRASSGPVSGVSSAVSLLLSVAAVLAIVGSASRPGS